MSDLIRRRRAVTTTQSSEPPAQPTSAATAPTLMNHLAVGPAGSQAPASSASSVAQPVSTRQRHRPASTTDITSTDASGSQPVNYDKYVVFCSPNSRKETAKEVSLICGSPLTEDLGKYLGMPMLHSRITKLTYGSLIDKVHKRLASWKSKFLSLAGRATLIQAVTSAVPIYAMQTSKLPVSVGQELDKLNRNFFWGGSEKKLKIHLCQWD
ncbi:hypothetical protein L3X38_027232 [Prunus dulcis]|uniref:Uncharacterized protein n=1 Tax=Prunus dulcis TaxID=3755 RepID=A0AAD4VNF7_PRUDU|nr:hypothetical protein L3X38_027232 [Prunus dulcis]